MPGKFEVYMDTSGLYRYRLKASTGEVVASGQGFPTAVEARRVCALVQSTCDGGPSIVEVEYQS